MLEKALNTLKENGVDIGHKLDILYLCDRITEDTYLSMLDKVGYHAERIDDHTLTLVKDGTEAPVGDYTNPIHIPNEGITIEMGKWYYTDDKDLPHEAVTDAFVTAEDFNDRTWFDFV